MMFDVVVGFYFDYDVVMNFVVGCDVVIFDYEYVLMVFVEEMEEVGYVVCLGLVVMVYV